MSERPLQPEGFLNRQYMQFANLPFCFSCGERTSYCNCEGGPLNQNEWMLLRVKQDQKPKLEVTIEDAFVAFAESKGCQAKKLRIDGENGFPDRSVLCPNGFVFFIEFKTPKGATRAGQVRWHKKLSDLGFIVLVVRQAGEAERFLEELLG